MGDRPRCRSCGTAGLRTFLALGDTPLADALVDPDQDEGAEARYPLDVAFCPECSLVQIVEEVPPERLFVDNYQYFSSYSDQVVAHGCEHAARLIAERDLGPTSLVVEIASNDGYLLKAFAERGVPVLGIDPAPGQAAAATAAGIPTVAEFFDSTLARLLVAEGRRADVVIANNVMAHTPHLNAFVEGIALLLRPGGVATVENPYVRTLVDEVEFDTVYHEHFSYFSCTAVDRLTRRHGLHLQRIESFPDLHGGTLRWTLGHSRATDGSVRRWLEEEERAGVTGFGYYEAFGARVADVQRRLLVLLRSLRSGGARIAAYGAAAKGATLINTTGIGRDLIDFVVDRNPHKQGKLMPGARLPIRPPEALLEEQPGYCLLLAWNFATEVQAQQAEYQRRGGRFIVPVPDPAVLP